MSEKNSNDFVKVVRFLWKWKFVIGGFSLLSAIAAIIFSAPFITTPKYEAYTIFYPSTNMSISRGLLNENVYSDKDFLTVGEGEDAEQLLQILQSDRIAEKLKKKYNLMEHYTIKPTDKYANTKFGNKFRKNVRSSLTEYTSIKVTVRDKDPELAAKIANDMVEFMDTIRNNMLKERAKQGLKIVEKDFTEKKQHVQDLIDSMNSLAKLGVLDYTAQSEALSTAYAEAINKGNTAALRSIDEKLNILSKYGPTQAWLASELEYELEQLVKLRDKYKQVKADVESMIPTKFIIERAFVPEKKAFPKRSVITLIAFISAFLFSSIVLIIVENWNYINPELKESQS